MLSASEEPSSGSSRDGMLFRTEGDVTADLRTFLRIWRPQTILVPMVCMILLCKCKAYFSIPNSNVSLLDK